MRRSIAIEELNEACARTGFSRTRFWRGSKIRLRGQWLQQAGFFPGQRVQVAVVSPGVIELRAELPAIPAAIPTAA